MRISLQREAGPERLPVYRQIAEQIRREIEAERLAAGARLPAIRDLARSLQVHRDTVALAYEELASAGVVESTVGRGTFVRANGDGERRRPPPSSSPSSRRSRRSCSSSSARARASAAPATPCRCTRSSPIPRCIRPTPSAAC